MRKLHVLIQFGVFDSHHAVSADFEEKLIAKLGANGVCPHGNDIRGDGAAERRARGLVLLRELKPGLGQRLKAYSSGIARCSSISTGEDFGPESLFKWFI